MRSILVKGLLIFVILLQGCASTQHSSLSPNNDTADALLNLHKEWKGTPYQLGGNSKRGIDCSGFTQKAYSRVFDIVLPRTTASQVNTGVSIPENTLKSGDLVFFKTGGNKQRHVGIYVQDGVFLHASTSKGVMLSELKNPYWKKHFWKAIRPEALAR